MPAGLGYVRLWAGARSQAAIVQNTHPWFVYHKAHRLSPKKQGPPLPQRQDRSAIAEARRLRLMTVAGHVMIPPDHDKAGKDVPRYRLLADLAVCDIRGMSGRLLANGSRGHATLGRLKGFHSWRINPPLYFGVPRKYQRGAKAAVPRKYPTNQYTTIISNKIATHWGWQPLQKLAEQVRSHGKIAVSVSWDWRQRHRQGRRRSSRGRVRGAAVTATPPSGTEDEMLDAANQVLVTIASQEFCQDWIVSFEDSGAGSGEDQKEKPWPNEYRTSGTLAGEGSQASHSSSSSSSSFCIRMSYFDGAGGIHEQEIWSATVDQAIEAAAIDGSPKSGGSPSSPTSVSSASSASSSFQRPSTWLVLQRVEACIRGATSKTHRTVHSHLRNAFRSRLWSEEFGSGHEEMTFRQIFASLSAGNAAGGSRPSWTTVEELLVGQHAALPRKRTRRTHHMTQSEFVEGLWIAGMLWARMPQLCAFAISLANRTANIQIEADRLALAQQVQHSAAAAKASSRSSSATALLSRPTSLLAMLRSKAKMVGKLSASLGGSSGDQGVGRDGIDVDGIAGSSSAAASEPALRPGHNVSLDSSEFAPRLTSYKVIVTWDTRAMGHGTASSLEATCTVDAFCVALDGKYLPKETVSRLNTQSMDTSIRCQGLDLQPLELFKQFEQVGGRRKTVGNRSATAGIENLSSRWVRRSQRFDLDLNICDASVHSLSLVLGPNMSNNASIFQSVGALTVRLERVHHSEQDFKNMAFEQRRKKGGTASDMEALGNLDTKVVRVVCVGEYTQPVTGPHSSILLGTFQRIKDQEWGFRLEAERLHGAPDEFSQIYHICKLQRMLIQNRRQCVHVMYCHHCERHQKTSWHIPGQFEGLFKACARVLKKHLPDVLVTGCPAPHLVGSFEVSFKSHAGAHEQTLYSALHERGWLPTPELVLQLVKDAVAGLAHHNTPLLLDGGESRGQEEDIGHLARAGSRGRHHHHQTPTGRSGKSPANATHWAMQKVMRFAVRDSISNQVLRNVCVHIFPLFGMENMQRASAHLQAVAAIEPHITIGRQSLAPLPAGPLPPAEVKSKEDSSATGSNSKETTKTQATQQETSGDEPPNRGKSAPNDIEEMLHDAAEAAENLSHILATPAAASREKVMEGPERSDGVAVAPRSRSNKSIPQIPPLQGQITLHTNERGRCETLVDVGQAYCVHVEAPGFYPIQIGATCVRGEPRGAGLTHQLSLLPLIEPAEVFVVDSKNASEIHASGIEVVLINRRTAVRHTAKSNGSGRARLHVPRGSYRIQVTTPVFDEIPYALTSDKRAMSFMETATAFDKARRDAAQRSEIKLLVQGAVEQAVGIPSMRWPWHFTVFDGATGKALRGVKFTVANRQGEPSFTADSSRDGTAFGMIELGQWHTLHVEMPTAEDSGGSPSEYLPFERSLAKIERKNSPLLVKVMMCPRPPPRQARAILCWHHRCWMDFHVHIRPLAGSLRRGRDGFTTGQELHVWKKCRTSSGATHDLLTKNGHGPMSTIFELRPLMEYRFSAVQFGSFKTNKETMIRLGNAKPEILVYDTNGMVAHEYYPEEASEGVSPERWQDGVVLRTDKFGAFST